MSPLDVVLGIVPGLSEKDRQKVIQAAGGSTGGGPKVDLRSACDRLGHKFKPAGKSTSGFLFKRTVLKLYCEKCGELVTREL